MLMYLVMIKNGLEDTLHDAQYVMGKKLMQSG